MNRSVAGYGPTWPWQAQQLQRDLGKIMRGFGRQCRGIGQVFVTLVRWTETQSLEMGAQNVGNPRDASYVEPLVGKVEQAIARVGTRPTPAIHSLAGDLALAVGG